LKQTKEEAIKYRIERAYECLDEAHILAETNHWNTVANRLYYACFYMLGALIIKDDNFANLHNNIKSGFIRIYIKTGVIDEKYGNLYKELYQKGQEEDSQNLIIYKKEEVEPLIAATTDFIEKLNEEIKNFK
jgi:uncharacterized protein (UPF0332 family)